MIALFKTPVTIHGQVIPARRFTGWALAYALLFVGVPVTVVTLLLDLLGWVIVVKLFGASCYGVGCLFG